jgi:hypothetical protein
MHWTSQVPAAFLLEFAHLRKTGTSSPFCAKKIIHPLQLGFGQSRSYSAPTSRDHLLEVGLLIVISVRVNKNDKRFLNFNTEFDLEYSVGLKLQY